MNTGRKGLPGHPCPDPLPRYSPVSGRNGANARRRAEGLLFNEKRPWDYDQVDLALDYFLLGTPDREMQRRLGRSPDGVLTAVEHKIVTRFPNFTGYLHHGGVRVDRRWTPLTGKDYAVVRWSLSRKGQERRACDPAWLAKLLARDEDEVRQLLDRLAGKMPGLLDGARQLAGGPPRRHRIGRYEFGPRELGVPLSYDPRKHPAKAAWKDCETEADLWALLAAALLAGLDRMKEVLKKGRGLGL